MKGFSLMEIVIFIILAALVIPIFYLTTQPVIKDMMTPTTYIKARFVAERKMEELMAYRFTDSTTMDPGLHGPTYVTDAANGDTFFPATDYAGYQWQYAINYLDCTGSGSHCGGEVGYTGMSLTIIPNPPTYTTNYKQIDLTVTGPQGRTYRATSAITARY